MRSDVSDKRGAALPDPIPGQHLWVILACWRVDPSRWRNDEEFHLDTENLLSLEGPSCLHCGQIWTKVVGARPCPGLPKR